jgi:hypothetical protein
VASWPAKPTGFRVDPPTTGGGHALHPGPYPPDLSRWNAYGCFNTDFSRAPSRLACRTRTIWQYRYVPALSGLLPALPGVSRTRLPPASIRPLRRPNGEVVSPPHGHKAPRGARFPRSTLTSYDRVGCPLYPGDRRCSPDRMPCPASSCHIPAATSLHSARHIPSRGAPFYEASTKVHAIHPSGLPLTRDPRDGTRTPSAFPSGFAPRRYQQRTPRAGPGSKHAPGTTPPTSRRSS